EPADPRERLSRGERIGAGGGRQRRSNDAQKFAEVFHAEARRPMRNGVLNPQEPHGLDVVRRIIAKLLGKPATEGQKVFFSVPAPPMEGEGSLAYHEAS